MKKWLRLGVLSVLGLHPGCTGNPVSPPAQLHLESEHFVFESTTENASEAEMTEGLAVAEVLFDKVSTFLGPDHTPSDRIRVVLEGDYNTQGAYVDFDGVHLFRYSLTNGGYWAVFAHEMVHAFGVPWFIAHAAWDWPTYRFFDEGFAEYVAAEVDPDRRGFPFFGFPEDVVVGHWVLTDTDIPPATLRERHEQLNTRCDLQAYSQRASWFRYLDESFGRAATLQVVYPDVEPTSSIVRGILGVGLDELDLRWDAWIRTRYASYPGAGAVAQAYGDRTPWYQTCLAGVDF